MFPRFLVFFPSLRHLLTTSTHRGERRVAKGSTPSCILLFSRLDNDSVVGDGYPRFQSFAFLPSFFLDINREHNMLAPTLRTKKTFPDKIKGKET